MRREDIEKIRKSFPKGTVVKLQEMKGESQMPEGLMGEVKFVDDIGQIHVSWANGSSLALNVEEDVFWVVSVEEKNLKMCGGMMTIE